MPCNYNPETGEVETLYERYQREVLLDEILYQQYIAEKIDNLKEKMKDMKAQELKEKMIEFISKQPNAAEDWDEDYTTPARNAAYVLAEFAEFIGVDTCGISIENKGEYSGMD